MSAMAPTARHIAQKHGLAVPPGQLQGPKSIGIRENSSQQLSLDSENEACFFEAYSGRAGCEWLPFSGHNYTTCTFGSLDVKQLVFVPVRQMHPNTIDVLLLSAMTVIITIRTLLIAVYPLCPRFLSNKIRGINVRKSVPAPASASACMAKHRPSVSDVSKNRSTFVKPVWVQVLVIFPHYTAVGKQAPARGSHSSRAPANRVGKPAAGSRRGTHKSGKPARSRDIPPPDEGGSDSSGSEDPDDEEEAAPTAIIRRFACPFAKRNPLCHLECLHRHQKTARHLKTHLIRAHKAPKHCPTCYEPFKRQDSLENHIILRLCHADGRESPYGECILEDQMDKIGKIKRGANDEERWFRMWDALFPGEARPEDPYSHPNPRIVVYEAVLRSLEPAFRGLPEERLQNIHDLALTEAQRGPEQLGRPIDAEGGPMAADEEPEPSLGPTPSGFPDHTPYLPATVTPIYETYESHGEDDATPALGDVPLICIQTPQDAVLRHDYTTDGLYVAPGRNPLSDAYPSHDAPFQSGHMSTETDYGQNTTSNSLTSSQDSVPSSGTAAYVSNEYSFQSDLSQNYGIIPNYTVYTSMGSLNMSDIEYPSETPNTYSNHTTAATMYTEHNAANHDSNSGTYRVNFDSIPRSYASSRPGRHRRNLDCESEDEC